MKFNLKLLVRNFSFVLILGMMVSGCDGDSSESEYGSDNDWEQIKKRGRIVAITGYNAYSYFIYRGQTMGFEYELLKRFADDHELDYELKAIRGGLESMFVKLNEGEGDVITFNLTITNSRKKDVQFTQHFDFTKQVLVQKRPDNWRKMRMDDITASLLRNPILMDGKTVHVRKNSAYVTRLQNLSDEIGGIINIVEADSNLSTENLIEMVANGEIEFTVADENIANLYQDYYQDLDVETSVSLPQKTGWAVRKSSHLFLEKLNLWIKEFRKSTDYYIIYNKYFKNRNSFSKRKKSDYLVTAGGNISPYDDLIKELAITIGWDWRLLASQVYQESMFDPDAQSWVGAKGLMQLMPATAEIYGVVNPADPIQNLKGGVKYIQFLDRYWEDEIADAEERIKFILASFNIGPGHIVDARNLAIKYESNPNLWFGNVENYLLKKSNEKYYDDEVVKHGFARGRETVKYVREVMERFEHYKQLTELARQVKSNEAKIDIKSSKK